MIKEKPIALPIPVWDLYQRALTEYDMNKKMRRHDLSDIIDGEKMRMLESVIELFKAKRPIDPNRPRKVTIQDVIDYHEELDKSVV